MSTDQVLFGIGLILALAVGSQVLASRLRIPALIILLPAGFTVSALTTDVNPGAPAEASSIAVLAVAVGALVVVLAFNVANSIVLSGSGNETLLNELKCGLSAL